MSRTPAGTPPHPKGADRFNEDKAAYTVRGSQPDLQVMEQETTKHEDKRSQEHARFHDEPRSHKHEAGLIPWCVCWCQTDGGHAVLLVA